MRARIIFSLIFGTIFMLLVTGPSLPGWLAGVVLGKLMAIARRMMPGLTPRDLVNLVRFLWDFIVDLTVSNIQIAWDVLTPEDHYKPKFAEVPVSDLDAFEIMILANRITLTPGTLSCDLTQDRTKLIVHVMYPSAEGDALKTLLRKPIDILKRRA